MREYTGMYIIHPERTEEEFKTIVSEIAKIFEEHGSRVLEIDEWGMKDFAYEIN